MKKRPWIVTEHSPIQKIEDNLWMIEGQLPTGPIHRRMSIIKMADGSLVFFHAIPLTEAELSEVNAWGRPAYLVVGHHQHCLDAAAFSEKLGLKVFGPHQCEEKLRARLDLAGTLKEFPSDSAVTIQGVPGNKFGEAMALVRSGAEARISLLFSDIIQNNDPAKLILPFRLLGFGGGPKIVPAYRFLFLKDKIAARNFFNEMAALPNLTRVVPFHGTIVDRDPAGALRAVATTLS